MLIVDSSATCCCRTLPLLGHGGFSCLLIFCSVRCFLVYDPHHVSPPLPGGFPIRTLRTSSNHSSDVHCFLSVKLRAFDYEHHFSWFLWSRFIGNIGQIISTPATGVQLSLLRATTEGQFCSLVLQICFQHDIYIYRYT